MKDGEIVQAGTSEEILTEPANEYVERFVENVDRSKNHHSFIYYDRQTRGSTF